MAKRIRDDEVPEVEQPSVSDGPEEAPTTAAGPTDVVRIVNFTKEPKQYHLTDGTTVSVGPKLSGQTIHKSSPVLKKLVGPHLRELAARKPPVLGFEQA